MKLEVGFDRCHRCGETFDPNEHCGECGIPIHIEECTTGYTEELNGETVCVQCFFENGGAK